MLRRSLVGLVGLVLLAGWQGSASAQYGFEPRFEIGGYLSTQVGVFFSTDEYREEKGQTGAMRPVNHGDKLGELSMFRNTLFIEMDWQPWEPVSLHAIFRGVLSLGVPADETEAEPPFPREAGNLGNWVRDRYYTEADLRELYLSIEATDWWSIRIGRQQVSWGELGQYRLLDVVNPTDTTWHFGPVESFEDTRIPLWMLDMLIEIRPLKGALELVWIPLLDKPERTVTTPLTFTGAWGLPLAPEQIDPSVHATKIYRKIFRYPGGDIEDSRVGVRWKGEVGNITYSMAYMYTHQLSPPIPTHHILRNSAQGFDVYLDYPRQHILGGSLEIPFESPFGVVMRLELAYEPNRQFAGSTEATAALNLLGEGIGYELIPYEGVDPASASGRYTKTYLAHETKHVITYGIQLMRPTMIRALNPTQNFIFVLQFMHEVVVDFDASEHLISVPGFDSTPLKQHSFVLVGVVTTNYLNGMIQPVLIGAYLPPADGFMSAQLRFVFGNHWRIQLAMNMFWGADPYNSVGFFRDRDEFNLKVVYQF